MTVGAGVPATGTRFCEMIRRRERSKGGCIIAIHVRSSAIHTKLSAAARGVLPREETGKVPAHIWRRRGQYCPAEVPWMLGALARYIGAMVERLDHAHAHQQDRPIDWQGTSTI